MRFKKSRLLNFRMWISLPFLMVIFIPVLSLLIVGEIFNLIGGYLTAAKRLATPKAFRSWFKWIADGDKK